MGGFNGFVALGIVLVPKCLVPLNNSNRQPLSYDRYRVVRLPSCIPLETTSRFSTLSNTSTQMQLCFFLLWLEVSELCDIFYCNWKVSADSQKTKVFDKQGVLHVLDVLASYGYTLTKRIQLKVNGKQFSAVSLRWAVCKKMTVSYSGQPEQGSREITKCLRQEKFSI